MTRAPQFDALDICIAIGLVVFFAPVYLLFVYYVPYQVNTDEITIMFFERQILSEGIPNPFGLSPYFGFPTLSFLVFGGLGKLMGGITLLNMRIVHALFGLAIVAGGYFFFRLMLSRLTAFGAAVILGSSHSLIAISRMAMRDNSGLFIEIAALGVLYYGLRRQSLVYSFLGGLVAGLSFYTYFPGRMTMVIWALFMAVWAYLQPKQELSRLLKLAGAGLVGFAIVAAPILIATLLKPDSLTYQKEQLLLFHEGRALQQTWANTDTVRGGVLKNITNGLTLFQNHLHDHGYIYPNYGHGFVDPLTGILLLVGIGISAALLLNRQTKLLPGALLMGIGLLALWLVFSFVVNKAPNYTRLLVVLPFAAYFAAHGASLLAQIASDLLRTHIHISATKAKRTAFCVILGGIFLWNMLIFADFVKAGFVNGSDVGATGRFMELRRLIPGYTYYMAADTRNHYYTWGDAYQWETWFGFFAGPEQKTQVLEPVNYVDQLGTAPFTVFMSTSVWDQTKTSFVARYPNFHVYLMTPDGQLMAVEALQ